MPVTVAHHLNLERTSHNMLRQGDVLLQRIARLPTGVQVQSHDVIVLAHGEVTGHAHTINDRTAQVGLDEGGVMFLTIEELTEVRHQEHAPLIVTPGIYRVIRQREWTDADEPRQVAD